MSTEGQSTIAVKETTIDPGSSRCFPRWWCTGSFRGEGRPTIFRKESSSMSKIRSMFRVLQDERNGCATGQLSTGNFECGRTERRRSCQTTSSTITMMTALTVKDFSNSRLGQAPKSFVRSRCSAEVLFPETLLGYSGLGTWGKSVPYVVGSKSIRSEKSLALPATPRMPRTLRNLEAAIIFEYEK